MSAQLGMTADELHSYLCRSKLPTLLVEGKGDKGILRRLDSLLSIKSVDVLPVGGKDVLDAVYRRRGELTGAKVVFLRDRDELCVTPVPADFAHYVLTTGYSIENDVLDRGVIDRLAGDTAAALSVLVAEFATWFRARLQNYILVDRAVTLSADVSVILQDGMLSDDSNREVLETALVEPFSSLALADAWIWLRGKSLLRVVHSHFQTHDPRYTMDQICDLCIKMGPSVALQDLISRVLSRF